jgi:integrase
MEPCRGSDSGSNPDSGASFLPSFGERNATVASKKFKPEFKLSHRLNTTGISTLILPFTREDLIGYLELRSAGLASKSITWLKKSASLFWNATNGFISVLTLHKLRNHVLEKYRDIDAKRKVLQFARAFLGYMSKINFDPRYAAFDLFLQLPRSVKEQKRVTDRIVTKKDVESLLTMISVAHVRKEIDIYHYLNYKAIVLFGAFTGQRPLATIARLTVGQLRDAMVMERPILNVLPSQDKIRMQHYCPLHPQVVEAILPILVDRRDDENVFKQLSFQQWLRRNDVPLHYSGARIVNGDLRKFCEQMGDILQWDHSNKNYIMTHGVSGIEWRFYKHPMPENVFDVYMQFWRDVEFTWQASGVREQRDNAMQKARGGLTNDVGTSEHIFSG